MTKKLKKYIEDFQSLREQVDNQPVRQARELISLQRAIEICSQEEELKESERVLVSDVINITDEWWCEN